MRWKHLVVGLALSVSGLVGCKEEVFIHEADYNHYAHMGLPPKLDTDASASVTPATLTMPEPTSTRNPERPLRYLSLAEAMSLALENGTTGLQTVLNPGFANDNLNTFSNPGVVGSDSIRVLSLDPAIVGANIDASLAKFDAFWTTSASWNRVDFPPSGTTINGTSSINNGTNASVSTTLEKPLPTGGVAGITFNTGYQYLTNPAAFGGITPINPAYSPELQFSFEQPLLQGFGVEINELRATHPGSLLNPFPTGGRVEGILITRIRFDEQRAEFQRNVSYMLLNVETAYWNLYGAYWSLYSQEAALRQAYEAWKINKARYEAGRIPIQDYAQTRQQYELFRGQRLSALGQVLEDERQLRGLIGLPGDDGTRLVPIDAPTLTPYQPDWNRAVNEAMSLRPELILARQDLKARQLDVISTKNLLMPDLRFFSTYGINGLGGRLDSEDSNAFRSLASDRFSNWSLGLRMTMPIGYRDIHSQVRVSRLNLARSYQVLQDQEQKAQRFLTLQWRHLFEFHQQIEIQRSQREAAAIQLEARFKEFLAGRGTLDILLEAQRVWATALQTEYANIVLYNNALAGFEFAKGTILQHDNIVISEGALPQAAQVRAVAHEEERAKAIVLRERANPIAVAPGFVPQVPCDEAAPVPMVNQGTMSVPGVHEDMKKLDKETLAPAKPSEGVPGTMIQGTPDMPKSLPESLPSAAQALQSLSK
jgi:outer membrane protein TolC